MMWRVYGLATALACGAMGCADDSDLDLVLDVLASSTQQVFDTIEEDENWQVPTEDGALISGVLDGPSGTLSVRGWRTGGQNDGSLGLLTGFAEKLYFDYAVWTELGSEVTGKVALTRHSLDVATSEGQVADASRVVVYQGTLVSSGALSGTYNIDVHSRASGTVAWTCGTINEEPYGNGQCY